MIDHHKKFSPSRFPMLAKCPCFEGGEVGEAAQSGTRQHRILESALKGTYITGMDYSPEEFANAMWAFHKVVSMTSDNRMVEHRLTLEQDFEVLMFGTADVVDLADGVVTLIDYKSGEERDYRPQMACYARMAMQTLGVDLCRVVELYGRSKNVNEYQLSFSDTDFIMAIMAGVDDPNKKPKACEFCAWCKHHITCDAPAQEVLKVAVGYAEPCEITEFHASEVTDPAQLARGMYLADIAEKWAKAWKHHTKKAMLDGVEVPGYRIARIPAKEFGDDVKAGQIYAASGLSVEAFSDCCTVGITKLREAIANDIGLKTPGAKKAKEEFNGRFGALLTDKEIVKIDKEKTNGSTE